MHTAHALDMIVHDVRKAIEHRVYYAALATVLTVPHVCAALEAENGWAGTDEYKDWCDRYLTEFSGIPSDIVFSLRCGFLHQGQARTRGKPRSKLQIHRGHKSAPPTPPIERVVFLLPGGPDLIHGNTFNETLQYDLVAFCEEMIAAMFKWWEDNRSSDNVRKNLLNLLQYREEGLEEFGIPSAPILG